MSTERRIKSLKLRLKSLVTSLNLIKSFVHDYDDETQADEVPVRLESLIKLWSDYQTVQSELETLDEAAIEAHLKERTSLESVYYRVKGFLLAHNKNPLNQSLNSSYHSEPQLPPSGSQVRLPDVKLPVFNGKLENWMNFHDLFVSLIHSSVGLSNIQKFYYLRSSLSDAALQLIQTIPISAINYPVAWNLLLEHFNNPTQLKQSYVDALFDFATIKRESAVELHSLVEKFEANVKVLQQLGEHTEYWDILLIRMLSIRLDSTTRRDWEEYSSTKQVITFKELTTFIQRRVSVLQSIQPKPIDAQPSIVQKKPVQRLVSSQGAYQINVRKCVICDDDHPLYLCESFSSLSLAEKEKEVRRLQLCRNCLRKGHLSRDCLSSSNCRKCRRRHHTQLCSNDFPSPPNSKPTSPQQPKRATPTPASDPRSDLPTTSVSATIAKSISCVSASQKQKIVLLATAVVTLIDDNGVEHIARALLDSGSECCFIAERFSQRIKAQRKKIHLPITGIGQASTQAKLKFTSTIRSRVGEYSTNVEFLVLPKVTIDLPATSVDTSIWDMPPSIQLADPSFDSTNPIDIIIGAEIFFDLFKVPGRIPLGDNLPVLVNSVFGWVVTGKSTVRPPAAFVVANVAIVAESDNNDAVKPLDVKFRTAQSYYQMLEGHFGSNPYLAQQHRHSVDKSLVLYRKKYLHSPPSNCYFITHKPVVQDDNTTTKQRVIFNVSCQIPERSSLNDAFMVGPPVLQEMRLILVVKSDTPLLQIVWPSSDLLLNTNGYNDTTSAPFLVPGITLHLADEKRDTIPEDFSFLGAKHIEVANQVCLQRKALSAKGRFHLSSSKTTKRYQQPPSPPTDQSTSPESSNLASNPPRGILAKHLIKAHHWLQGSDWFRLHRRCWLSRSSMDQPVDPLEEEWRTSVLASSSPIQSSFANLIAEELPNFQHRTRDNKSDQQHTFSNHQPKFNCPASFKFRLKWIRLFILESTSIRVGVPIAVLVQGASGWPIGSSIRLGVLQINSGPAFHYIRRRNSAARSFQFRRNLNNDNHPFYLRHRQSASR